MELHYCLLDQSNKCEQLSEIAGDLLTDTERLELIDLAATFAEVASDFETGPPGG